LSAGARGGVGAFADTGRSGWRWWSFMLTPLVGRTGFRPSQVLLSLNSLASPPLSRLFETA
jgi:hypothetical protein